MKIQSRWLAIGSGRVDFSTRQDVPITFIITRGIFVEHFSMDWAMVDEPNITQKIIHKLKQEAWYSPTNIQGIWTQGSTIAGMGILRFKILMETFQAPLISLTDTIPDRNNILNVLKTKFIGESFRIDFINENDGQTLSLRDILPECSLWITCYNIPLQEAVRQLKNQQIYSCWPEGLRIAQLIAKNLVRSN